MRRAGTGKVFHMRDVWAWQTGRKSQEQTREGGLSFCYNALSKKAKRVNVKNAHVCVDPTP